MRRACRRFWKFGLVRPPYSLNICARDAQGTPQAAWTSRRGGIRVCRSRQSRRNDFMSRSPARSPTWWRAASSSRATGCRPSATSPAAGRQPPDRARGDDRARDRRPGRGAGRRRRLHHREGADQRRQPPPVRGGRLLAARADRGAAHHRAGGRGARRRSLRPRRRSPRSPRPSR